MSGNTVSLTEVKFQMNEMTKIKIQMMGKLDGPSCAKEDSL